MNTKRSRRGEVRREAGGVPGAAPGGGSCGGQDAQAAGERAEAEGAGGLRHFVTLCTVSKTLFRYYVYEVSTTFF